MLVKPCVLVVIIIRAVVAKTAATRLPDTIVPQQLRLSKLPRGIWKTPVPKDLHVGFDAMQKSVGS